MKFAMERGNAYVDESWDGAKPGTRPLQRQVRALFEGLGVEPQSVLAGHLVPFRSRSWKQLKNKDSSLRLGKSLWSDILERAKPTLIVGMGHQVFEPLSQILKATNANPTRVGVGWGNVTAVKAIISNGSLVVLPHLSRFGIITRQESADALKALFGEQWQTR